MAVTQIENIIEHMKLEFDKKNIVQKRAFLERLKQKTISSKNIEYLNFLNECIISYNHEVKNNVTSLNRNAIASNLSSGFKAKINHDSRDEENRRLKLEWIKKNEATNKGIGEVYEFCANLCGVDKALDILVGVVSGHAVKGYYTEAVIAGNFVKGNILKILKVNDNRLKIEWLGKNRKINRGIGEIYDFCTSRYGTIKALDILLDVKDGEVIKKNDEFAYIKEVIVQGGAWDILSERDSILKLEWLEQNWRSDKSVGKTYNFYAHKLGTKETLKLLLDVKKGVVSKKYNSRMEYSDIFTIENLWEKFKLEERLLKLEWVSTLSDADKRAFDYYENKCGREEALEQLLDTDGKAVMMKSTGDVKIDGVRVKGDLWAVFRGKEKALKLEWIKKNRGMDKSIKEVYDFCVERCGKVKALEALFDIQNGVIVKNLDSEIIIDKITIKGNLWEKFENDKKRKDILRLKWMSRISKSDRKIYNYYKEKCGEDKAIEELLDISGKSAIKKTNGQVFIDGVHLKGDLWSLFKDQEKSLKLAWIAENRLKDENVGEVYDFCVRKLGQDKALEVLLDFQNNIVVKNLNNEISFDDEKIKGNLWNKIQDYGKATNLLKLNWVAGLSKSDKKIYDYYKAKCGMQKALDELLSISGKFVVKKFSGEVCIDGVNIRGNLWVLFKAREKFLKVEWIEKNKDIDQKVREVYDFCMRKCGKDKALEALLEIEGGMVVKKLNGEIVIDGITIQGDLWTEIENYSRKEAEALRRRKARKAITREKRVEIFERDGYRCVICGASAKTGATLEIDHKIPISKGGTSEDENLQTLCFDCNTGKGAKILKEAQ